MRRTIIAGLSTAILFAVPAGANVPLRSELNKYTNLYYKVKKEDGSRAPGRMIRWYGVRTGHGARPANHLDIASSIKVLRRQLIPYLSPAPPPIPPSGALSARVTGGPLDAIGQCESGGDYGAISPDGQYRGKYQFDYGTWASVGGSGDPAAASPGEQDSRAALLYAQRGAAPWPVCGR